MKLKIVVTAKLSLSFLMLSSALYSSNFLPKQPLTSIVSGVTEPLTASAAHAGSVSSLEDVAGVARAIVELEQRVQDATTRIEGLVANQTQLLGRIENLLWWQSLSWVVNIGAAAAVILLVRKKMLSN